jgi:ribosomal-protein-alanine N-acetyltransferase
MKIRPDDILTPRLVLRLIDRDPLEACLEGDLKRAERSLGIRIPGDLLNEPTSLKYAKARLDEDSQYQPWSVRAVILASAQAMVGHIRFHSRPDPDYLRPLASSAVEFGYHIFPKLRRRGYATEAAGAMMDWAQATSGVGRFIVSVSPNNGPSLALAAHFGFVQIGQHMDEIDGIENIYLRDVAS